MNDINPHLLNFYRWLKKGLVVTQEFENDREHFYEARRRFNELISSGQSDSQEAAEWFYYLNRTGYNGLCRFNKKGEFNVPFGRYKTISYIRDFTDYANVIAKWEFTEGDFAAVTIGAKDFVYADPPYDVAFTGYSTGGFDWSEQVRLAEWLASLDVPVVASNHATERVLDLYTGLGFAVREIDAPRRISSNGDRTPAKEVLATRNL